ncbi:hypothetical protein [Thiolapillus sp.]|uniref:hypothetical protein n=1 Tax=Thiolapillus sp. TaxID=2017437 RepID=UPI0025CF93B1|nr:hypothetical protein [Thiolapillus sp.]
MSLLLPGQVYRKDLQALLNKYPDAEGITVIPVLSRDKVSVTAGEIWHEQE